MLSKFVPPSLRLRAITSILTGLFFMAVGFQNCSGMKSSLPVTSKDGFRLGNKGERIREFQPTTIFSGGGMITVTGENLLDSTEVKIGGATCLESHWVSQYEIQCRAPAMAAGSQRVEVAGAVMPEPLNYVEFSKVNSVAGRNGLKGTLDGVGRLARMNQIGGMVSDGETLYFTEYNLGVIRTLDLTTFETKTIAGLASTRNRGFANGIGPAARFNYPSGLAVKNRTLYIADRENCMIRKMDLATNEVTVLAGLARGYYDPCPVIDGAAGIAQVGRPEALHLDGNDLYMGERAPDGTAVIRKINLTDLSITTVAGQVGLEEDNAGIEPMWTRAATSLNQELILATPVETAHPTQPDYDEYEFTISQPGAVAMRLHFTQVELGPYDKINIEDADNNNYLTLTDETRTDFWTPVLPTDTVVLDTWFYDGTYGFKVDKIEYTNDAGATWVHSLDGPATSVMVGAPASLIKFGDDLYFSDGDLDMVRKVNLTSKIMTAVTGGFDSGARKIGKFWETKFSAPMGLAVDSRYLYIADLGDGPNIRSTGERIIKMDLVTRESSVLLQSDPAAGNPANIDGPLANAAVMQPRYMVYDPKRGLFFDCFDVIRRIK